MLTRSSWEDSSVSITKRTTDLPGSKRRRTRTKTVPPVLTRVCGGVTATTLILIIIIAQDAAVPAITVLVNTALATVIPGTLVPTIGKRKNTPNPNATGASAARTLTPSRLPLPNQPLPPRTPRKSPIGSGRVVLVTVLVS